MDQILFIAVLLFAYFAAHLFIKWDNKRIEAECKFTKRSDHSDKAQGCCEYLFGDWNRATIKNRVSNEDKKPVKTFIKPSRGKYPTTAYF